MLQDFTVEHDNHEVIALALRQAIECGVHLDGYFICPAAPVIPQDEFPSHTLACYRQHHGQPVVDPARPISGHIATIGKCLCFGNDEAHLRFASVKELAAAAVELLRGTDPSPFLDTTGGTDGPFRGTDATVKPGFRLHYCSCGMGLSFRHIYVGK